MSDETTTNIKLYDPSTKIWKLGSKINTNESDELRILGVLNNRILVFLSDYDYVNVTMFDLFSTSPNLQQSVPLSSLRPNPGVGVLNNSIYVVSFIEILFMY